MLDSLRSAPQPAGPFVARDHEPSPGRTRAEIAPLLEVVLLDAADDATTPADRDLALRLATVCRGQTTLPVFPAAARALDRQLRASRPVMRDVLRTLQADPELTRRVVERASAVSFGAPPAGLDTAIVRIGLEGLWRVAMQSLLGATLFRVGPYQPLADAVRDEGARVAELAAVLAGAHARGEAYLAGLLHGVGTLTILRFAGAAARGAPMPSPEFVDALRVRCQSAVGVVVTSYWDMPASVVSAIADHAHHHPTSSLGPVVRAARVALASIDEQRDVIPELTSLGVDPSRALAAARVIRAQVH